MKLSKKEFEYAWLFFYASTFFFGTLLERLDKIKSNPKDDIIIFGIIIIWFYILLAVIVLFFYVSNNTTAIDVYVLWSIFVLVMSLGALTVRATEERLETLHYIGCSFVQLYIIYVYEAYFKKKPDFIYGCTYFKRVLVRIKRLGRDKF